MEKKNVWNTYTEEQLAAVDSFAKEYIAVFDVASSQRSNIDLYMAFLSFHIYFLYKFLSLTYIYIILKILYKIKEDRLTVSL